MFLTHWREHWGGGGTQRGHSGTLHWGLHWPFRLFLSHVREHVGARGGTHGGHSGTLHWAEHWPFRLFRSHVREHVGGGGTHRGHSGMLHSGVHWPFLMRLSQVRGQIGLVTGGRVGCALGLLPCPASGLKSCNPDSREGV